MTAAASTAAYRNNTVTTQLEFLQKQHLDKLSSMKQSMLACTDKASLLLRSVVLSDNDNLILNSNVSLVLVRQNWFQEEKYKIRVGTINKSVLLINCNLNFTASGYT